MHIFFNPLFVKKWNSLSVLSFLAWYS